MTMEPAHALGRLIDNAKGVNGWSDTNISRRAASYGMDLSKSYVSRLRGQQLKSVSADLIQTLAVALDVPAQRVIEAVMDSWGIPWTTPSGTVLNAVNDDLTLSTDDKQSLLVLYRFMARRARERRRADNPVEPQDVQEVDPADAPSGKPMQSPVESSSGRMTYVYRPEGDAADATVRGLNNDTGRQGDS